MNEQTDQSQGNQDEPTEEEALAKLKESRGAQLRALIVAWYSNDTYQRALQEQAQALREEGLVISDDWGEMAEHILDQFAGGQNVPEVFGVDGNPV